MNFKNSVFYAQVPPSLGPGWAFSKYEESTDRLDDNWQKVGNGGGMNLMVITMFENHRKSLIQHCERSELRLHFLVDKSSLKMPKILNFGELVFKNSVPRNANFYKTKIG